MDQTIIHRGEELTLSKNKVHPELYQKEFLTAKDADKMNIQASSILFEQLKYKGAVLPHYHDVCEIICITKGEVILYANDKWEKYHAGDTFIVPAKAIHSVVNVNKEVDSEQISFFIPQAEKETSNVFFHTEMVEVPSIEEVLSK